MKKIILSLVIFISLYSCLNDEVRVHANSKNTFYIIKEVKYNGNHMCNYILRAFHKTHRGVIVISHLDDLSIVDECNRYHTLDTIMLQTTKR